MFVLPVTHSPDDPASRRITFPIIEAAAGRHIIRPDNFPLMFRGHIQNSYFPFERDQKCSASAGCSRSDPLSEMYLLNQISVRIDRKQQSAFEVHPPQLVVVPKRPFTKHTGIMTMESCLQGAWQNLNPFSHNRIGQRADFFDFNNHFIAVL